jgi:hypothetical protein
MPRKKQVDPDALQQRALKLLEKVITTAETDPVAMALKGGTETVIKISDHLRKLNEGLNSVFNAKVLGKLSEADLDALEAADKKGRR